jgi:hypothetical protein
MAIATFRLSSPRELNVSEGEALNQILRGFTKAMPFLTDGAEYANELVRV